MGAESAVVVVVVPLSAAAVPATPLGAVVSFAVLASCWAAEGGRAARARTALEPASTVVTPPLPRTHVRDEEASCLISGQKEV